VTAALSIWKREPAVVLRTGDYEATFLPGCGMLGASLRYRGEEYVAWPRTIADVRAGVVTAIPLVHPWGNRLGAWTYRAAGRRVDLRGLDLATDPNGLPIHGNLRGAPFEIAALDAHRLRARFDYGAHPDKLAAFPFPHTVEVDARLGNDGLHVSTVVEPTTRQPVPVSFCWHPYFQLPAGRRATWTLRRPACEHVDVDDHVMPTGARTKERAEEAPIGARTYDDHYALGSDRRFSVAGAGRRLQVTFDGNYPFGQLYAPPRREFLAIEPMTATIDALRAGTAPLCPPGRTFRATFTVACGV
jgi:galactose mutarotase-like enzyme